MLPQSLRSSPVLFGSKLSHSDVLSSPQPPFVKASDIIQDLYVKELRAFKPTPIKASDAEGHVQRFTPPKLPRSPEEDNIANDLKAYEDQQVEVEGQAAGGAESMPEEDWFEEEDEEEAPAAH
ncbi:hypothetical protein MMC16_000116 [Acarospora aff. strigata]|nr:hypothetical protein [Acarospora aff. strigata]